MKEKNHNQLLLKLFTDKECMHIIYLHDMEVSSLPSQLSGSCPEHHTVQLKQ